MGWIKNAKDERQEIHDRIPWHGWQRPVLGYDTSCLGIGGIHCHCSLAGIFSASERKARMNLPGTTGNNWMWRAKSDDFTDKLAEKLADLTVIYGRNGKK